jgi:glycolate oxidase iron-sulfur subunit
MPGLPSLDMNPPIQETILFQDADFQQKLARCIHCGLCLQACPTYAVYGTEMDSPRGRIALIRLAAQGGISPEDFRETFSRHIRLCLACRSCESACPSGVQFGSLVETARIVVENNRKPGWGERLLRWWGIEQMMPHLRRLKALGVMIWFYEFIGLQRLIRGVHFLPAFLQYMESILPPVQLRFTPPGKTLPALIEPRGDTTLFVGCIQEGLLSAVNQATIHVLQRNGFSVTAPAKQTCCGAAHLHLGDLKGARELARQNIDVFLAQEYKNMPILCNAGGCGLSLKEYPHLLKDDAQYAGPARRFADRVQDISEFLAANLVQPPLGLVARRAVYADSCHLRHGQKVVQPPRQLLSLVPGLELVEMATPERCCGSAGVYNIAQKDTANAVLDAKMADITASGADLIVSSNTGCHMQLLAGARRAGLNADVLHVVEVLELSYNSETGESR